MLQCLRRTGHLPSFFVPTPGDLTVQESPPPGICHPRPKNANAWGLARGGAGHSWNWLMHNSQTSRFSFSYSISYDKNFTPKHLDNTLTHTFCLNFTNIEPTVLEKKVPVNDFVRFPMPRIIIILGIGNLTKSFTGTFFSNTVGSMFVKLK